MTDEEKKAKRAAYMVQWRENLSRFQKEKRRLQNSQYRKKVRESWTLEQLEKVRQRSRIYYAKNKEKLLANMAIYRENKKKEKRGIKRPLDYLPLKIKQMTTIFTVMYFGNAKRYQDLCEEVGASSKRHAVEKVYAKMRNEDYFPEDEFVYGGLVRDCDGNVIAEQGDETIEYDGGYFYAEPLI